jgi:hypothetical protein
MDIELIKRTGAIAGMISMMLPDCRIETHHEHNRLVIRIHGYGMWLMTHKTLLDHGRINLLLIATSITHECQERDPRGMPGNKFDPYDPSTWASGSSGSRRDDAPTG